MSEKWYFRKGLCPFLRIHFKWYSNTTDSNTGGTKINGAEQASYNIPTGKNAGTTEYYYCVVTATRTDNNQTAEIISGVAKVTVGRAQLTITVKDQEYTYNRQQQGEADPAYANPDVIAAKVEVSGLVGEDKLTSIILTGTKTDAGEYENSIVLTGWQINNSATATANYNITKKSGKLTIKPIPVTVAVMAVDRGYIAGNKMVALTAGDVNGLIDGDTVTVDVSAAIGTMADANAGENKPVTVTGVKLSGTDAGNYALSEQPTDVTVTINKAANPATVTGTASVTKGGNTVDLSPYVSLNGATGEVSYAISGDAKGCSMSGSVLKSGSGTGSVTVNVTVAADNNYEALTAAPITVTITDKPVYAVTVEHGTGDGSFEEGATVTITADAPETGKEFDKWTTNDGVIFDDANAAVTTFIMPAKAVTVTANYKTIHQEFYSIDVIITGKGAVDVVVGKSAEAQPGDTVSLIVAPDAGYKLDRLTYTPSGETAVDITDRKQFEMPAADVTVHAVFVKENNDPDHPGFFRLETLDILPKTGFPTARPQPLTEKAPDLNYQAMRQILEIPSLSAAAEIVLVPLTDGEYPVTWLGENAGLLEGSALPGEGQSVITGHNHLNTTAAGPFAGLSSLEPDDRIFVRDERGQLLIFKVTANVKVAEDDVNAVNRLIAGDPLSLTLITCEDERPEGGYANRRLIAAKPL
ncbi:MAG: sortase [Flexilinea sp.]|nr:sortase [Flexilinea sp.]